MRWEPGQNAGSNLQPAIIAFCRVLSVTEPQPVAPPTVVQPLDQIRPVEIVTAGAQGNGTITITLTQLYNQQIWQRLAGLNDSMDLVDILRTMSGWGDVNIVKYVNPPVPNHKPYTQTYIGCKLATIGDDQPIDITTAVVEKDLTFWYKHYLFSPIASGQKFT